jgi:hypothetical protein
MTARGEVFEERQRDALGAAAAEVGKKECDAGHVDLRCSLQLDVMTTE